MEASLIYLDLTCHSSSRLLINLIWGHSYIFCSVILLHCFYKTIAPNLSTCNARMKMTIGNLEALSDTNLDLRQVTLSLLNNQ